MPMPCRDSGRGQAEGPVTVQIIAAGRRPEARACPRGLTADKARAAQSTVQEALTRERLMKAA